MLSRVSFRSVILTAVVSVSAMGCGGEKAPLSTAEINDRSIKQVGQIYANFTKDAHKPPVGVKDFKRYAQMAPGAYNAVNSGDVDVIWGVKLEDLSEEGSKDSADEVLAYEKQVPKEGGLVLMKNRTVRKMTADEFKAAPKAAGSKSSQA